MPIYRPRMRANLSVPVFGSRSERKAQADDSSAVSFPIQVNHAEWTQNNHNHADELSITVDWRDAGVDPRLLGNGIVDFYLGQADDSGKWQPTDADRRFTGMVTTVERSASEQGMEVEIHSNDFTTLFIESKPYPPEGVPRYSENLQEAWARICKHTGGKTTEGEWFQSANMLSNRLKPIGVDNWPPRLGGAVYKRFGDCPIPMQGKADAWAVWQHCCGMLGLISWVDKDEVVVTTRTNLYTSKDPPRLIWGKNIETFRERRNCAFVGKKIALLAYDPLKGQTIQALWPGPKAKGAKKVRHHTRGGKSTQKPDASMASEYDVFEFNGITDPDALLEQAKRVYEERSRQEMTGRIVTREMRVETMGKEEFDLLKLKAGDDVRIEVEQEAMEGILGFDNEQERIDWLVGRGYTKDVATLIAKNASAARTLNPTFHVEDVRVTFETDEDGGTFQVEIGFINKINVIGDSES